MSDIIIILKILDVRCELNKIHLENSKIFKAFCDETRLEVLSILQSGEKCACEILESVSVGQSTLSHHMKILVDSGIVAPRKERKWIHYSISKSGSEKALKLLSDLTAFTANKIIDNKEKCKWTKE